MRPCYQNLPAGEHVGEPLPDELVRSVSAIRSALDAQLAAAQDASYARQKAYNMVNALPGDHYFCYMVGKEQELGLVTTDSEVVHKARIARGRVALGRVILFLPDTYTHVGELTPLVPNWNPRRIKPLLTERTQRVRIALSDLGNITEIDSETANKLVGDGERVIDPGELVNIFRTRKRGDLSRQHASRSRGAVVLRSV